MRNLSVSYVIHTHTYIHMHLYEIVTVDVAVKKKKVHTVLEISITNFIWKVRET